MDLSEELTRIALDSSEDDPSKHCCRVIDQLKLLLIDEKASENRELGVVLGGLTANYAVARTIIRSQTNFTSASKREIAPGVRRKGTVVATKGRATKSSDQNHNRAPSEGDCPEIEPVRKARKGGSGKWCTLRGSSMPSYEECKVQKNRINARLPCIRLSLQLAVMTRKKPPKQQAVEHGTDSSYNTSRAVQECRRLTGALTAPQTAISFIRMKNQTCVCSCPLRVFIFVVSHGTVR